MARLWASASLIPGWWIRRASTIWAPTVYTGVRALSGSWKTMATWEPRMRDM